MAKQLLPTVSVLNNRNAHDRFLSKEREEVVLVGYIDNNDDGHNTTFYGAAEKLHEDFPMGITSDAAAAQAAGVSFPALVMYKPDGEGTILFDKEWTVDAIKTFAKTAYKPLIGETGSESWRRYVSGQDGPTAFVFHKNDADRKRMINELRPVARRFQGQIQFATAEIPDFLGFAAYLHLPDQADDRNFPALAIYDGAARKKYPFDNSKGALNQRNVEGFVQHFLKGSLEPTVKSEPIPSAYEGPVTKVVAKTYDEVIMDAGKDVLIYYFREDCPYCQAMNPVYDTLGSMYALPDRKERVTIGKYDINKNDLFEDIPYVPYVKLYRAGDKTNSVIYSGDRSIKDLIGFVKEQGTHKVDALQEHAVAEDAVHGAGDAMGGSGAQQAPLVMDQLHGQPLQGRTPVRHIHDEL